MPYSPNYDHTPLCNRRLAYLCLSRLTLWLLDELVNHVHGARALIPARPSDYPTSRGLARSNPYHRSIAMAIEDDSNAPARQEGHGLRSHPDNRPRLITPTRVLRNGATPPVLRYSLPKISLEPRVSGKAQHSYSAGRRCFNSGQD